MFLIIIRSHYSYFSSFVLFFMKFLSSASSRFFLLPFPSLVLQTLSLCFEFFVLPCCSSDIIGFNHLYAVRIIFCLCFFFCFIFPCLRFVSPILLPHCSLTHQHPICLIESLSPVLQLLDMSLFQHTCIK